MADDGETNSEPLAVRIEQALEKRHPFSFPGVFIAIGFTFFFIFFYLGLNDVLINHPDLDPFELLGYPLDIDYFTITAIAFGFIILITFVVYFICLIPVTLFIILGSKGMITFGFSQETAKIGEKFGGIQMVLRSMLPGLFGIGVGVAAFPTLIRLTETPSALWPLSFTLITTLYYGLSGLTLGMALFPATWFADDSGLVIQGKLTTPYREPPRVVGAGNWLRSVFAGLTVFLYPLVMIRDFILVPFTSGSLSPLDLLIGLFVIVIGIPVVMMSISLPFVLLTEKLQSRVQPRIRSIAARLGAKEIEFNEPKIYEVEEEKLDSYQ
ncbi:MAG: hypothetical protein ACXACG_11440 [Candidatus Thorarchaeota archaeon]|jgi:hypothetical protein